MIFSGGDRNGRGCGKNKKMILADDENNTEEDPEVWKRVEKVSSLLKANPVFAQDDVLTLRLLTVEDESGFLVSRKKTT